MVESSHLHLPFPFHHRFVVAAFPAAEFCLTMTNSVAKRSFILSMSHRICIIPRSSLQPNKIVINNIGELTNLALRRAIAHSTSLERSANSRFSPGPRASRYSRTHGRVCNDPGKRFAAVKGVGMG